VKRLGYAPQALIDLQEIALFIARDNPQRSLTFIAELEAKAEAAALRPDSFRERAEISPGLRAAVHGRYLILFRDLGKEVRIIRVIHSARDLGRLFEP